jgi:putative ABC transport system permease protein
MVLARRLTAVTMVLRNLALHKPRLLLPMLAQVAGVSSAIVVMAVAEGASRDAQRQAAATGATGAAIHSVKGAVGINQSTSRQREVNLVLVSVAALSFLVGGLGIMSIMLVTVSERTREIGIRRALGARRRDIIEQFLIETTAVSATGAFFGVILGLATLPLAKRLLEVPIVIRPSSPILAFLISVAIGVSFGVYPAYKAATLDPAAALRDE